MIGKEVNETRKDDLCTATSKDTCGPGVMTESGSSQPGGFGFAQFDGDLLAVGGPEDLLYVGDDQRVQEFDAQGEWKG
jgi:hypothetical protein